MLGKGKKMKEGILQEEVDKKEQSEHSRWFTEILAPLLDDLKDFPYAIIKGPVLAVQAYGDEAARSYHDIDFLIPKDLRKEFIKILEKNDFIADVRNPDGSFRKLTRNEKIILMNSHQDIDYIKKKDDIYVDIDINYDLFWGEYKGKRIDIKNDILCETFHMNLFGQDIKVLSKAKNFIQLCLHHYREMNAIYLYKLTNPFVQEKFRDVYYLLRSMSEEDLEEVHRLIADYEIANYIYYVIYHTYHFYKALLLKDFLERYETPEARLLIHSYGLTDEEKKVWPIPLEQRSEIEDLYGALEPYLSEEDIKKVENVVGFITLIE